MYMGRVFITGGGCMVPCNCTKDKNSIKQIVACVVCYSGSKYGTYFLITHFIFYFKISIQENGAKTFLSTRSDYACF